MEQTYVGVKLVTAWPEVREDLPGYGVRYEDGYISWSPKAVFEAANLVVGPVDHFTPAQQMIVADAVILTERIRTLNELLNSIETEHYTWGELELMKMQVVDMQEYLATLNSRIEIYERKSK